MTDPYAELHEIWKGHNDADPSKTVKSALAFLHRHNILPRQDDGRLRQVTLSKPISVKDTLVIGLRYEKRDGTQTEDHFAVKAEGIERRYRGKLEAELPEYKGTHKQQIISSHFSDFLPGATSVNTITITKGSVAQTGESLPPGPKRVGPLSFE